MKVLCICEHGSAKSVIAAAHLERIAREREVDIHAVSRATSPDSTYPPHVVAGLRADGLAPLDDAPRQLTPADFEDVAHVIAFCDVTLPAASTAKTLSWSDVPPVSDGYREAREEIVRRIEDLVASM